MAFPLMMKRRRTDKKFSPAREEDGLWLAITSHRSNEDLCRGKDWPRESIPLMRNLDSAQ